MSEGPTPPRKLSIRLLPATMVRKSQKQAQGSLDLQVEKFSEQDIGMGVLSDGTPFLTQRGLAELCGVQNAHIGTIGTEWNEATQTPRISTIKDMLLSHDVVVDLPYTPVKYSGRTIYAYPDRVCMAVLEYYAFAAGTNVQPEARANFRRLAAGGLKKFIYDRLGYKPVSQQELWQQFHDRVSLNFDSVPTGYFSVFKEIASVLVTLISAGVNVGKQVVPDISVGQHWSRHWLDQDLEERFGQRQKYEHNYPEYFPQADANPQTPYCYPDAALGEFRRWLQDVYLEVKLPVYFQSKVKEGKVIGPVGEAAIQALSNRPRARLIARSS